MPDLGCPFSPLCTWAANGVTSEAVPPLGDSHNRQALSGERLAQQLSDEWRFWVIDSVKRWIAPKNSLCQFGARERRYSLRSLGSCMI